jgi:hypothetical protein
MRFSPFNFFLLGLFALLAVSVPVTRDNGGKTWHLDSSSAARSILDGDLSRPVTSFSHVAVSIENDNLRARDLDYSVERRKRATTSSRKPAKTKPSTRKGQTAKKPAKSTPSKGKPTAKKPAAKTPTAKKPAAKKPAPKVCTRADTTSCGKSESYKIVERAAKKKPLRVGESYLLKTSRGGHKALVLAKITQVNGVLDVSAVLTQLVKEDPGDVSESKGMCLAFFGNECGTAPVEEFDCKAKFDKGVKFSFVGAANPEFADKTKFFEASMRSFLTHVNW